MTSNLAGALSLTEAAKLSQDDLQRGVLEIFVQESPILDRIPFLTINGNAYAYNQEESLPGVAFRSVNESYDGSTGTVNPASERLFILGGDADVDTFIQQTRGDLNNQRAIQTRLKVKAASFKFQDTFINGDETSNPKEFDGLKNRLTGSQVITSATPAAVASAQDHLDELDELFAALNGDPDVIYANRKYINRLKSLGRRIGGVEMVREDLTGKRVVMWNGVPVLDLGQNLAGDDILPLDEGVGGDETSLYAVKFGSDENDRGVTGLTNGGVQVRDLGEIDSHPAYRTRIEFFCGLAVFGGKAAARLQGVKFA